MNPQLSFTSFPSGWFRVAESASLPNMGVIPLRYFGKDLVLFRTEDGTACVMDAHCPHLGAHLGYGGKVEGETIQCPFHGWCFDSNGHCTDIPYTSKIPSKAQIKTWLVREVNGLIMVYYHAIKEPATWEIPELPEYTSEQWTPWSRVFQWKTHASIQDLSEVTVVDTAHFGILHPDTFQSVKSSTVEVNSQVFIHRMSPEYNHLLPVAKTLGLIITGFWEVESYGLGYHIFRSRDRVLTEVETITLFTWTPIDEEYVEACIRVKMKKVFNEIITRGLRKIGIAKGTKAFEEDLSILEHKLMPPHPLFCDGDGPLSQYRRWSSQFYKNLPARTPIN